MASACDELGALATVSDTWFDFTPSVFFTCNCATFGCASGLPLICAASVDALTYDVGTAVPFTVSAELVLKFDPCTVTVTLCVPAVTTCGETCVIDGTTAIAITVVPVPQPENAAQIPMQRAIALKKSLIRTPDCVEELSRCTRHNKARCAKDHAQYIKRVP